MERETHDFERRRRGREGERVEGIIIAQRSAEKKRKRDEEETH